MKKMERMSCPFGFKLEIFKKTAGMLERLLKRLEYLGSSFPFFAVLYNFAFYRKMLQREIAMVGLKQGDKVVHVGCGPLPLTALTLAEKGFEVEALDNDARALEKAADTARSFPAGGRIEFKSRDGAGMLYSSAEAVWVSFHVYPREKVLKNIFFTLKEGGKIVYRNPRGWLALLYPRVEPDRIAPSCSWRQTNHLGGKETIIIKKNGAKR